MFDGRSKRRGRRRWGSGFEGNYRGERAEGGDGDGSLRLGLENGEGRGRGGKDGVPYFVGVVLYGDGGGDQGGRVGVLGGGRSSGDGSLPTIVDGESDEGRGEGRHT